MEEIQPPRRSLLHRFRVVSQILPLRLVSWHLREHLGLLLVWVFLLMIIFQSIGTDIGIPYLFLEPEYLGETGFLSMMILGMCTGIFTAAYQISSFLHDSYRYEFLVLEKRPFFTFCINNFLVPATFMLMYGMAYISFSLGEGELDPSEIVHRLSGYYLGVAILTLLILGVVFRFNRLSLLPSAGILDRTEYLRRRHRRIRKRNIVSYFLSGAFSWEIPGYDRNVSPRMLSIALNRHHASALLIEILLIANVVIAGAFEHIRIFQIPAAGSMMVILSILMLLMGAFSFWFRRIGPVTLVLAAAFLYLWAGNGLFMRFNPASGMQYSKRVPYTPENMEATMGPEEISADSLAETRILDRWLLRQDTSQGRPVLTLICSSGGGLRSGYFTFRILQQLDSLSGGNFYRQVYLQTGASGGMIAAAYFRDLYLRGQDVQQREFAQRMSADLLNRLGFRLATGMLAPGIGGYSWLPDRGISFDHQLAENLGLRQEVCLQDYAAPESLAICPRIILSPTIMNDATRLYITSIPASWLTTEHIGTQIWRNGIDLLRFFEGCAPEQLSYITALRMNATFPLITPYVELPTAPPVYVMDAGASDNHGIQTTVKFISFFRAWIDTHCSGVRIIHIRDSPVTPLSQAGGITGALDPIAGVYGSLTGSKNFLHRALMGTLDESLSSNLEYYQLVYTPVSSDAGASLSWHLTPKEINDIDASVHSSDNLQVLLRLTEAGYQ